MNRHATALVNALNILKQPDYLQYIEAIYLYGSCARGDYSYKSDVDLFLVLRDEISTHTVTELRKAVSSEELGLPEVELKFGYDSQFSSSEQFNSNIKKDGRLLWKRE